MLATAPVLAQTITQGYNLETSVSVQRGMVVGLKKDDPTSVEPVNNSQLDQVHGVVVGGNDASITLSEDDNRVFVASAGKFEVLVSDQNGAITAGDLIALSPITGIAMKSDELQPYVLGKAIDTFDETKKLSEATIRDAQDKERTISIGRILVDIAIGKNPNAKNATSVPGFLKDASEFIAGKPVNPIKVYISLVVLIVSAAISGALIYSGVRSAMIAIGRNPLSKKSIIRGLIQVVIVSLIIFITGIFGVYLLLKL